MKSTPQCPICYPIPSLVVSSFGYDSLFILMIERFALSLLVLMLQEW